MLKKNTKVNKLFEDIGGEDNVSKKFFKPCTLTDGIACAILILNRAFKGQRVLFCTRDWSKKETNCEDDTEFVEQFNKEMIEAFNVPESTTMDETTLQFEAVVGGQFEMSKIFSVDSYLLAPDAKLVLNTKHVKAVFLERMSSYTRTFDFSIVNDIKVIIEFSAIHRRDSHKTILSIFKNVEVYTTGPDPLEWPQLLQLKKNNNLNWAGVHKALLNVSKCDSEEEGSEWEAGNTEDEEEESEYSESDEEDLESVRDSKSSGEWSSSEHEASESDYDRYERLSRPTKKFKTE